MLRQASLLIPRPLRNAIGWSAFAGILCLGGRGLSSDTTVIEAEPFEATPILEQSRLDSMEQSLQGLVQENGRLAAEIEALKRANESFLASPSSATAIDYPTLASPSAMKSFLPQDDFYAGYDNGLFIRPRRPEKTPFSVRINHQNTFRFTGFEPEEPSWVDSTGATNPIFSSTDFSIPRGRLILSGNTLMPELTYLLNIDYNTVTSNPIGFRAFVLSYRFSQGLQAHVGQNKVPGSREWLHSSFDAQEGPDRSMATTFFRPSLSQGIWFTGEPLEGFKYHSMISNGFNTLNVRPDQLDDRFCGSGSIWWEPWGEFGRGYSDIECHREAAIRLGSCLTFTKEAGSQASDYPENTLIRLSDGTLVTQLGALAPGVTLQRFDLSLVSIDLAFKYQGLSLSTEIYRQGLGSLRGTGPLGIESLQTYGGVAQGGYFVIPRQVEFYSRNSFVTGAYGSGTEIAGGLNWFVLKGKSNLRYTLDLAWLDSSPADQNRTGFLAGQSGYLLRTQITSAF